MTPFLSFFHPTNEPSCCVIWVCASDSAAFFISLRSTPDMLARDRLAPYRLAPYRLAPDRSTPYRLARDMLARDMLAPYRLAPDMLARDRLAPYRLAPDRSTPDLIAASTQIFHESHSCVKITLPLSHRLISYFIMQPLP